MKMMEIHVFVLQSLRCHVDDVSIHFIIVSYEKVMLRAIITLLLLVMTGIG